MESLAALTVLALLGVAAIVVRTIVSQRKQEKQTSLDLFLPVLDSHLSEWMEAIADERVDTTISKRKAEERGIDPRMMYVIEVAEGVLTDHGHELDFDELYGRAQGVYDSLRSSPESHLYKPKTPEEIPSA